MNENMKQMIATLDPEIQGLVTEVILAERRYLDMKTPVGVKQEIKSILERYVKEAASQTEESA